MLKLTKHYTTLTARVPVWVPEEWGVSLGLYDLRSFWDEGESWVDWTRTQPSDCYTIARHPLRQSSYQSSLSTRIHDHRWCFTATWLQIKWHVSSLSFSWWCKWIQTETEQSEFSIPGEPEAGKHKRALKSMTCSRPYSAARSRGVSCWLFLIVGSVSSCSSTETTSVCPYWAAQWRAVSFWWFCEKKQKQKWLQDEVGGRWTADTPGVRWTDRGGET